MGLDMYLEGRAWAAAEDTENDYERVERLGYWRKHPDLHGYIVQTFAGGVDECQRIELSADDLGRIAAAVKAGALPKTRGFFFGESTSPGEQDTLEQLAGAAAWLKGPGTRRVVYRASW
jgi:hypothetical protein